MRDRVFPAVRRAIVTHRLLEPGEGVVVAVSGGADSVVLLHCLLRLRADWSLTLHVAHFDHGLREGSHRDARFVEELATAWDVPVTTDAWAREGGPKRSLQAEARRARYRFLGEVAAGLGAAKIALAHHRDDQAETVLLHLLRGSGLRGLRGMLPLRDDRLIRPLLQVGREEIERYAKAYRLSFVEDPSNRDLRYLRNRLRWNLMPVLRREYNPSLPRTLARMAAVVAEEEAYLAERAREAFEALAKVEETRVCLDLASLRALAPALRRRVIERAVRTVTAGAYVTTAHLEAVDRLTAPGGPWLATLPGDQGAWSSGNVLSVGTRPPAQRSRVHCELPMPGEAVISAWGLRIGAAILPCAMANLAIVGPDRAYVDWTRVVPPLVVRTRRPGDRLRPLGLRGSKKLQDLFVDGKVPREERERTPVVTDQQGILWVPGFRVDERGRVGDATQAVLTLTVHRDVESPRL
ncbi:MAG: tRNA lysidine(34) synthetase TilS [candidate division NC10 bacterium]|nr:tRNA lysidine(34) synthetase TilS [candidate division NC10 bacterium]